MFFTPNKILSYNCILNFVVSPRGAGKTHGTLLYVLKKCAEKNRQFIYLRRTDTEVQKIKGKLFDSLYANGDLKSRFFCDNDTIVEEVVDEEEVKYRKTVGYVIPLSLAKQYKSAGFPLVDYILFDEFISEDNRYLKDEVSKFLSIFETVARHRTNVKAILLGNLSSTYNPYFLNWNLTIKEGKEFTVDRQRGIVIQNYDAQEFREMKKETPFAKLIEGSEAGDFILDNKSILDDTDLVMKVKEKKNIFLTFITQNVALSMFVFTQEKELYLYIAEGDFNNKNIINLDKTFRSNSYNIARNNEVSLRLKRFGSTGNLYFENPRVKALCENLVF